MDERELQCSEDDPLIGWRLFRVRPSEDGFVLTAPLIHDTDFEQFPSAKIAAACYDGEHPAPAPGCRCGLYVAIHGTLDSLSGYLRDSAHDADPPVYAEVACTGRVFLDARGVRAERIEVIKLAISESAWPDPEVRAEVMLQMGKRYDVEVCGGAIIPSWVHANDAPRGAPAEADHARVDLDRLIATISRRRLGTRARENGG